MCDKLNKVGLLVFIIVSDCIGSIGMVLFINLVMFVLFWLIKRILLSGWGEVEV